ncbi:extensin family protein [Aminobacter aminovorans]|nr:extensin family protein [Aminobacter aminovorans]
MLPDKRSNVAHPATMPIEETACRTRLKVLGAEFEEHAKQSDADGCALPFPLKLKRLSRSIDIKPDAIINCATAETSARFAANVISPAAKTAFGEALTVVNQASAYVCRPRNGTRKLSEHAFGNALDIARFTLSGGTAIDVEPAPPDKNAKFLDAVRKAACGPFKTVLGPGSDADHAQHLHFDLAPRKNGGTFCQ